MSREVHFYALPATIRHDKTRHICMEWDYERTDDEVTLQLYEHLHPGQYGDYDVMVSTYAQNKPYTTKTYPDDCANPDWCPWCAVFAARGLHGSALAKGAFGFRRSNDDPVLTSNWHFRRMYPGHLHTDFVNRFNSKREYRQIQEDDCRGMRDRLGRYGTAYCTADREANAETLKAIAFCEKWLAEPDTIVVYETKS